MSFYLSHSITPLSLNKDPILGTRYKSVLRRNYDVCERCLQENHNGVIDNNFVAFTQRVSIVDTRSLEPTDSGRSITVYSFGSLAEQLAEDPKIEDVTFYVRRHDCGESMFMLYIFIERLWVISFMLAAVS